VQLKHVLKDGSTHFYGTQVTLGIVSVLMCAAIGKLKTKSKEIVFVFVWSFVRNDILIFISRVCN